MGLFGFGKKKTPELRIPSAQEIAEQAMAIARQQFPEALGAREKAAQYLTTSPFERDISIDVAAPDYAAFGPTSLEEALASQYFANVMPDIERSISHQVGLRGMGYSPVAPALIARERGRVGVDIGQYLSELGQTRATQDLERRLQTAIRSAELSEQARQFNVGGALGIDPMSMITPYANLAQQQSMSQAMAEYNRQVEEQSRRGGIGQLLSTGLGAGLGALFALPTGGMSIPMGAALGAAGGGLTGSALFQQPAPITFGQALQLGSYPETMARQTQWDKFLQGQLGGTQQATPVK